MSDIMNKLIEKRKKWIEANRENGFEEGIKNLLTDLYPDSAHFVFELLQNAEDAKASAVKFILFKHGLVFEHNGSRLFTIDDVDAITSIGKSFKKDDPTNIGKFGVGFKSVYAYTSTPEVVSGEYHFEIHDLVVPITEGLEPKEIGHGLTRITIPFNNPGKQPEKAVTEIQTLLNTLNEGTLLFLESISKIEYSFPDGQTGYIEREESDDHFMHIKSFLPDNDKSNIVHYLRYRKEVEVVDDKGSTRPCRVSIAYKLEKSAEAEKDSQKTQWKVKPIEPGRVSIYFPADKETSNLKFHINAPFASTVARDSVRDCDENNALRDHIANLVVESLFDLRDKKLLTVDCLSVLPNDKDNLPSFYLPIKNKVVEAFKEKELTPMKMGGHAAASGIFRGSAAVQSLIKDEDLIVLFNKDDHRPPIWVANALINSRSDGFLSMLEITRFEISNLIIALFKMPDHVSDWIKSKSNEWHQQLYVLLNDRINSASEGERHEEINSISGSRIVRLTDGTYETGKHCFFPDNTGVHDEQMPMVEPGVYSSGNNKDQQEKAKQFLERIGVSVLGKAKQIELLLEKNYSMEALANYRFNPQLADIKLFMRFLDDEPSGSVLFENAKILKCEDGVWRIPTEVYLDEPFFKTGLSAFYEPISEHTNCRKLSEEYKELDVSPQEIGSFAEKVGAVSSLRIVKISNFRLIDYTIDHISYHLKDMSFHVSKLLWDFLMKCEQSEDYGCYSKQLKYSPSYHDEGNSQILNLLSRNHWVPQTVQSGGDYSFVLPMDADLGSLPEGFTYNSGWRWLKLTSFGNRRKQQEELKRQKEMESDKETQQTEEVVKSIGFNSLAEVQEIAEAKKKDPQGLQRWIASTNKPEFPQRESPNPVRRSQKIQEGMADAPQKTYEQRSRSVRVTGSSVDAVEYLRSSYKNEDGQLICQICKDVMPFKKRNGEYYMEKVEVFTKEYLTKEHHSHNLALCPLCSAKYNEYVKTDTKQMDKIRDYLLNSAYQEIPISLDEEATIKFVETHYNDLRDSMIGESIDLD